MPRTEGSCGRIWVVRSRPTRGVMLRVPLVKPVPAGQHVISRPGHHRGEKKGRCSFEIEDMGNSLRLKLERAGRSHQHIDKVRHLL